MGLVADPSIIADRYGRRSASSASRHRTVILFGVLIAALVGFAAWTALDSSRDQVTWSDLGVDVRADDTAVVRFQVELTPGRSAICAVRVVNDVRTEVGRRDIRIGPSADGVIRTETTVRTTERGDGGGVRTCVLD